MSGTRNAYDKRQSNVAVRRTSSTAVRKSSEIRRRKRRRQRIRQIKQTLGCIVVIFLICGGIALAGTGGIREGIRKLWNFGSEEASGEENVRQAESFLKSQKNSPEEGYPKELLEMLEKNPETYDFVSSYPERSKYQGKEIDLIGEITEGKVPLFLQWDRRWGYDSYGNEMIAIAGCGPTCMSMACVYLTGDVSWNPKKMAEFANENGYYTQAGTSWSFFTDGAYQLGLSGEEIGLDEARMKDALDSGNVIICSMRPGDFTTTGHFILIRGYDEEGFLVNDPNSEERSKKHWAYDTLYSQIKCLWSIGA